MLVLGRGKEGFRGSRCGFFRGVAYRSTSSPRSFSILTVFGGVVRRVWVVLVVARVLICLVRAFQFFEVAVVEFGGQAVGFASGTLPHRSVPPSLNLVTCNGAFAQVNRRTTRFLGK